MDWGLTATIAGFVLQLVGMAGTIAWVLQREMHRKVDPLDKRIRDAEKRIADAIDVQEVKVAASLDEQNRRYQETFMALRTKITETELWSRDHYIQRGPFQEAMQLMRDDLNRNREEVRDQLEKLYDKVDDLTKSLK